MKNCYLSSISIIFLTLIIFSCNKHELVPENEGFLDNEIKLVFNSGNMPKSLASFGVISFNRKPSDTNTSLSFIIDAQPVIINQFNMDLENAVVNLSKNGKNKYTISIYSLLLGEHSLYVDEINKTMKYTGNRSGKVDITGESYSELSTKDKTYFILLHSLLSESLIGGGERVNTSNARMVKLYYGYTVGWGLTREESINHESLIRASSTDNQMMNYCMYLGTSTSCYWENMGCITTSTYWCGSN